MNPAITAIVLSAEIRNGARKPIRTTHHKTMQIHFISVLIASLKLVSGNAVHNDFFAGLTLVRLYPLTSNQRNDEHQKHGFHVVFSVVSYKNANGEWKRTLLVNFPEAVFIKFHLGNRGSNESLRDTRMVL